jgi:hypothetical protein
MENAHTYGPTQQRHGATSATPGCDRLPHNDFRQSGLTNGLTVLKMWCTIAPGSGRGCIGSLLCRGVGAGGLHGSSLLRVVIHGGPWQ